MVTYPIDWKESSIGDLFNVSAGGDVKKQYFSKFRTSAYPYEIFSNGIENRGHYGYTSLAVFPGNSVTVTARGTIGQAFYRDAPYDAIIRLLVLSPKSEDIKPKFYEYYINNQIIFERENTGVPQLTAPKIKEKTVPLFDGKEQEKIIETLQIFDDYIDDLAELIEKKKGIRDGAINDLLSGKTRLNGFNKSWKETTLGAEFDVIMGSSPNSSSYNSAKLGVPLVQGNADIENRVTAPKRYTSMPTKICEVGDTILTVRAPVGAASRANQKVCLGRGVCAISGQHKDFIFYLMRYHESAWEAVEQGSTFTAVSGKEVRKFEIRIPGEGSEQEAIAAVLTAMDEEIRDLEIKREKMIQIREGAMDDLLTGRVRLTK